MHLRDGGQLQFRLRLLAFGAPRPPRREDHQPDGQADEPAGREHKEDPGLEMRAEQRETQKRSGAKNFSDRAEAGQGKRKSQASTQAVEYALGHLVFRRIALSPLQSDAVGNDERYEGTQRYGDWDADGVDEVADNRH